MDIITDHPINVQPKNSTNVHPQKMDVGDDSSTKEQPDNVEIKNQYQRLAANRIRKLPKSLIKAAVAMAIMSSVAVILAIAWIIFIEAKTGKNILLYNI